MPLADQELGRLDAYWRAANYLTVGQIYLMGNPLLREPLRPDPRRRLDGQPTSEVAQGHSRHPVSLNYLLSSHVWRQDNNGFSHQYPGFIDHVVNKKAEVVRVYLPPDANTLLSTIDHCLRSRHYINVVVAGKQPAPTWLSMDEAIMHSRTACPTPSSTRSSPPTSRSSSPITAIPR